MDKADIKCITIGDQVKSMKTMAILLAHLPGQGPTIRPSLRLNSLNSKGLGGGLKKGEDPQRGGDGVSHNAL